MSEYNYDIGIIGGGAAGLTVASGAAQLGAKTLIIEKEDKLGGDCLHYGCVPSKTLIHSAQIYHMMKNSRAFGLPDVKVPPIDFKKVVERIRWVVDRIQKHDSEARFCSLGAKVEFGEPAFVDDHSVKFGNKKVSAKFWVVASGSSPDVPPVNGLDKTPFLTNREIFYLDRLPESLIILGAGPIAVEMSQAFCRLGTEVHVIQRSGQVLSREDRDMADGVMEVLSSENVHFHLNSSVLDVRESGNEKEVRIIKNGENEVLLKADEILVTMGRKANINGLNLERIGIEFDEKGIHVDQRLRTSRRNIYAAGDVTGNHQFTHAAGYEGGIIITNILFHLPRKTDYTFMPHCIYTAPELASIGMNEKSAKESGIDYSIWTEKFHDNDRSLAEGEMAGKIKMLLDKKEKPLGVQILGPHAGELISEWVAVMNGNVRLSTVASAIHPYPTLGEINKRVAGNFFSGKIFSDRVKKGLKLFFNLKGRACLEEDL